MVAASLVRGGFLCPLGYVLRLRHRVLHSAPQFTNSSTAQMSGFVDTRQCLAGGSVARLDRAAPPRSVRARPGVVRATATTEEKAEDNPPKLTFGANARAVRSDWRRRVLGVPTVCMPAHPPS